MEKRESIQHFSHPHSLHLQLVLNEDQLQKQSCRGCLEPLFGPCFSCGECQFHLHKKCAHAPFQITHSPFHRKHPAFVLQFVAMCCDLCRGLREMFYYCCSSCEAAIDIKCAFLLHNIDENFRELKHVHHQHPLTFIENPNDELKRVDCYWCQKPLVDSVFVCLNCSFYLHKKCAQLPTQINHPSHRKHFLYVEDDRLFCHLCQSKHWSLFYRCSPCKFDIDIQCIRSIGKYTTIEDQSHQHQFTQLFRNDSFMCDACGTEGKYVSYICSSCHIMVHDKCVELPSIINITCHDHDMSHNHFFQKTKLEEHDCGICHGALKAEYGSYNCLEQNCNFVVHVDCAMEMYVELDQANDEADEEFGTNSSITCVLERNEHGEVTKLKHFSHEHDLILGNKPEEDDDKRCDGCMLSISTSFYYCSGFDFFLHKTCAKLPRKKNFWFHPSLASLINSTDIFKCDMCKRLCNGLVYEVDKNHKFCLRCARVSRKLKCKGHKHPLLFDPDYRGECNGCAEACWIGAHKCKYCSFALDCACITLPEATRHKCDEHILKLVFQDKDYPEQYYCDICEEKRVPNLWFYHCAICDTDAHPQCALGTHPFFRIKTGTAMPRYDFPRHPHPLVVVETMYDTCSACETPCRGLALKCTDSTCDYIIHLSHCDFYV